MHQVGYNLPKEGTTFTAKTLPSQAQVTQKVALPPISYSQFKHDVSQPTSEGMLGPGNLGFELPDLKAIVRVMKLDALGSAGRRLR